MTMKMTDAAEASLYGMTRGTIEQTGWALVDLPATDPVFLVRDALLGCLRGRGYALDRLEEYREDDDARHEANQAHLTEVLRATARGLIALQAPRLSWIAGAGYLIQREPFLRIARPGVERDNIGYHRDTDYGSSPEELSVWVPFVNLPGPGSLEVAHKSHLLAMGPPPALEEGATGVTKGSRRHKLGFPYAPRVLPTEATSNMFGVPVRVGQALVFTLALVHGTTCNRSDVPRFSADIRIAPAAFAERARPGYYW